MTRWRGEQRELGVSLIVLYKGAKAVAELVLAAGLVALAATGEIALVRELATALKEHVTSRWSLLVGRLLAAVVSEKGVHLLEIGLALDGVLSAIEGWSLWRGFRWGPWLVVAATAIPLPLEILHIAKTHRATRVALLLVNLSVVAYLSRRIARARLVAEPGRLLPPPGRYP